MSVSSVNNGIERQPALALALTIYQYCLSLIVVRPCLSSLCRVAHLRTDRRITGHLPYRHRRACQLEAFPALQLGVPEQHRTRWDQVQEHDRHEHLHDGRHAVQHGLECNDRGGVTKCTSADDRGPVRDVADVERRQDRQGDRRGLDKPGADDPSATVDGNIPCLACDWGEGALVCDVREARFLVSARRGSDASRFEYFEAESMCSLSLNSESRVGRSTRQRRGRIYIQRSGHRSRTNVENVSWSAKYISPEGQQCETASSQSIDSEAKT